jgi:hypothetical protein
LSHPPITSDGGGVLRVTQWMRVTSLFCDRFVAGRVDCG